MNNPDYFGTGAKLFLGGCLLTLVISYSTCQKWPSITLALYEGGIWSTFIFAVYWLLNSESTKNTISPIFSDVLGDRIGNIYAILLITCIVTARMFHTVDVATCIPTKNELKDFEEKLGKELKNKTKK
jgi:hypothetical protein